MAHYDFFMTIQMNTRSLALDALRGIAIGGMVLSGSIAYNGVLPAWMYHAQVPPPAYRFNPALPGITWVDLVFPFFLFALGAAIPFAYHNKPIPQTPREYWRIGWGILKRGLVLAWFAIVTKHARTYALSGPPEAAWYHALTAIACFVLLFPALMRLEHHLPATLGNIRMTTRAAAFIQVCSILLLTSILFFLEYPASHTATGLQSVGFWLEHSDIIILVLSNVAVFGTVIWLATRTNPMLRLGLLAFYLALRLSLNEAAFVGSWQHWLWFATPATWLFKVYFLQYLFIVLPGTVAGDLMLACIQGRQSEMSAHGASNSVSSSLLQASLLLAFTLVNLVGLFTRALTLNLAANVVLLVVGFWLFRRSAAESALQTLHRRLYHWGAYWLLLGLFFEAFEGGIKKDKSTLSYYFLTSGLAFFWLAALSIFLDEIKLRNGLRAIMNVIVANGQNPMIAYVAGGMLLLPLLRLSGSEAWFNGAFGPNVVMSFLRGVLLTSVVMLVTLVCTRRGWFWRA
jgi:hypothetical protein